MPRTEIKSASGTNFVTELSWGEAGIQIATVVEPPRTDDAPETLAAVMANWDESTLAHARGLHVDLDRDSINQLIRQLRRARTAVYGTDE